MGRRTMRSMRAPAGDAVTRSTSARRAAGGRRRGWLGVHDEVGEVGERRMQGRLIEPTVAQVDASAMAVESGRAEAVPPTTSLALLREPCSALAKGSSQSSCGAIKDSASRHLASLVASCWEYAVPMSVHERHTPAS